MESCFRHFRRCDLSKSLTNLVLGFFTCKWGWPLTPQGSFSLDATVVLGSHPIYLCPLTCGQAVCGHAPCCPAPGGWLRAWQLLCVEEETNSGTFHVPGPALVVGL